MPDFSTKEKAQKLAGLDLDKLVADKNNFRNTLMSEWMDQAVEAERLTDTFVQGLEEHASYPVD